MAKLRCGQYQGHMPIASLPCHPAITCHEKICQWFNVSDPESEVKRQGVGRKEPFRWNHSMEVYTLTQTCHQTQHIGNETTWWCLMILIYSSRICNTWWQTAQHRFCTHLSSLSSWVLDIDCKHVWQRSRWSYLPGLGVEAVCWGATTGDQVGTESILAHMKIRRKAIH